MDFASPRMIGSTYKTTMEEVYYNIEYAFPTQVVVEKRFTKKELANDAYEKCVIALDKGELKDVIRVSLVEITIHNDADGNFKETVIRESDDE